MKRIIILSALISMLSFQVSAKNQDGFFFQPSATIEYSAPALRGGGENGFMRSNNFGKQISGLENFTVGGNFRVHKNLGFNANWAQSALHNSALPDVGALGLEARFKIDHYNFSALGYLKANEIIEFFAEAGVSDMSSRLNFVRADGSVTNRKAHETKALYGAGLQFKPNQKSQDQIRLSFQKYAGKLALLDSNYTTVRIGYLKAF
jgi:hypothetical protein